MPPRGKKGRNAAAEAWEAELDAAEAPAGKQGSPGGGEPEERGRWERGMVDGPATARRAVVGGLVGRSVASPPPRSLAGALSRLLRVPSRAPPPLPRGSLAGASSSAPVVGSAPGSRRRPFSPASLPLLPFHMQRLPLRLAPARRTRRRRRARPPRLLRRTTRIRRSPPPRPRAARARRAAAALAATTLTTSLRRPSPLPTRPRPRSLAPRPPSR